MVTVAISGFFDPIHGGHIEYIREARKIGDKLIVILNNDNQCILKKGESFMPMEDKIAILNALRDVDAVVVSIDNGDSVLKTLEYVNPDIWGNGGDRNKENIPEAELCKKMGIKMVDNLGEKIQSSSWLIKSNS